MTRTQSHLGHGAKSHLPHKVPSTLPSVVSGYPCHVIEMSLLVASGFVLTYWEAETEPIVARPIEPSLLLRVLFRRCPEGAEGPWCHKWKLPGGGRQACQASEQEEQRCSRHEQIGVPCGLRGGRASRCPQGADTPPQHGSTQPMQGPREVLGRIKPLRRPPPSLVGAAAVFARAAGSPTDKVQLWLTNPLAFPAVGANHQRNQRRHQRHYLR